ncbi:MAG: hypothetical protein WC827_03340 [Candidatus Paceibacterota bacterium]|jgi:hypothetical protein
MEEIEIPNFERIPLKNRLHFQLILMKMMLGNNLTHEVENDWVDKYSTRISNIIDDSNNGFIRELIMKDNTEEYREASEILIRILDSEEKGKAA